MKGLNVLGHIWGANPGVKPLQGGLPSDSICQKENIAPLFIVPSSGNVFGDLGLRDAEERQTKVGLAVAINHIVQTTGLSQTAAADRLHLNEPKTSALAHYRLNGFSVERLTHLLNVLVPRDPNSRAAIWPHRKTHA